MTWVSFAADTVLSVLKIAAGIVGRSGALIADGIHSLSDLITDLIVLVMVGIAGRKPDAKYTYGHGKYETMATLLISMALGAVAIGIFYEGLSHVIRAIEGEILPRPTLITLIVVAGSIGVKEWLFHYTRRAGERLHSAAIVANAWHHRSDSLSSMATVIGIAGAMFLGQHWRVLDPIAAMTVSVFIGYMAVKLGAPAFRELLDAAVPADTLARMMATIRTVPGVITFHHVRTRRIGNTIGVDLHLKVKPDITVVEGHKIASKAETALKREFGSEMIVNIHVEPYRGEKIGPDGSCRD